MIRTAPPFWVTNRSDPGPGGCVRKDGFLRRAILSSDRYLAPRAACSLVAMPTVAAPIATRAAMPVSIRRRLSDIRRSATREEAVDGTVERGRENRSVRSLSEGAQVAHAEAGRAVLARAAEGGNQRADPAGAEVAVDVAMEKRPQPRIAHDIAADHGAGAPGGRVGLDRLDGGRGRWRMGAPEGREALEVVPAEVGATGRGQGQVGGLL